MVCHSVHILAAPWAGRPFFAVSHLTAVSAQSPADMNATLIIGVIIMKSVTVSGAVVPGEVGLLFFFKQLHSAKDETPWCASEGIEKWVYTMLSKK